MMREQVQVTLMYLMFGSEVNKLSKTLMQASYAMKTYQIKKLIRRRTKWRKSYRLVYNKIHTYRDRFKEFLKSFKRPTSSSLHTTAE